METKEKMIMQLPLRDGEEETLFGVGSYMLAANSTRGIHFMMVGQFTLDDLAKFMLCMFFSKGNKYAAALRKALRVAAWKRITGQYIVEGTQVHRDN